MNYQEDVIIDVEALDVEWAEQADLFGRYAEQLADANKEVNRLAQKEKVIRSKLILEANSNPSVMGEGIKPTGGNVEAYFRTHEDHIEVKEDLINAIYEQNILEGAVSGMRQRKGSLENLVILHGQHYFAGPVEPRNLNVEIDIRRREKVSKEGGAKTNRNSTEETPEERKARKKKERQERRNTNV